jgi:ABC-type branched-subunit amino acid transport system permease subunit
MDTFLLYALLGIASGAVYAILSQGVVAIYKGSGVVNFAQAAIAMFAAYCYVALRNDSVPTAAAMAITIVGAGLAGFAFSYGVMRPLRSAPVLAKVVTTLGLFTALTALVVILWPTTAVVAVIPSIFPANTVSIFGGVISEDRFWLAGVGIVLAVALWAVYRFTAFGRATRAAAENERGAALIGYSPDFIAASNWALGSALAGLAGILVVPQTGLDPSVALLIVPVLAACLLGRFTSFPVVTAAAFGIGALQSLAGKYWNSQPGVQEAIPFLVVIIAMVVKGRLIPERGALATGRLPLAPPSRIRVVPLVLLAGITVLLLATLNHTYQTGIATSLIMAIIALSLVVVTGFVGQISLAQMSFAGVGAFAVAKFATDLNIPFPIPILLAALLTVPVGILIGLPALRVRGINLAVITLGAAVTVSSMVFQNPAWTGSYGGSVVPSPKIAGLALDPIQNPVRFGIFGLIVLILVLLLVINVRRSPTGRRMLAVRANERAAAAAGVSVSATKLQAFALSSFIAALGGGVLAYQLGNVSFQEFDPTQSIFLLTLVVIGGVAVAGGGLVAGLIASGGLIFVIFSNVGAVGNWWAFASGVLVVVTVVLQPDGAVVAVGQQWRAVRARFAPDRGIVIPPPTMAEAQRGDSVLASDASGGERVVRTPSHHY